MIPRRLSAIELQFDYYGPFGFGAVVARLDEPMFDLNKKVIAQMLRERESPSTAQSSTSSIRS